jgi:Uma2 family endonuclease
VQRAAERSMDQRVVLHGVSWSQYEQILAIRGESAGVRMTYLRGELELMSPSKDHEWIKTTLARLVEAYTEELNIEFTGYGSWTIKSAERERGAEPDECYVLGNEPPERPDLAIEVVWTSGGIDKLEVYRGLGVKEVWFWKEDRITIWELDGERYSEIERSRLLPDLDLVKLAGFLDLASQTQAVRALRAWVRGEA